MRHSCPRSGQDTGGGSGVPSCCGRSGVGARGDRPRSSPRSSQGAASQVLLSTLGVAASGGPDMPSPSVRRTYPGRSPRACSVRRFQRYTPQSRSDGESGGAIRVKAESLGEVSGRDRAVRPSAKSGCRAWLIASSDDFGCSLVVAEDASRPRVPSGQMETTEAPDRVRQHPSGAYGGISSGNLRGDHAAIWPQYTRQRLVFYQNCACLLRRVIDVASKHG